MEIVIPYRPHAYQKMLHACKSRFMVVNAGRRTGKTEFALAEGLKRMIGLAGTYAYIASDAKQANRIVWNRFLELLPKQLIVAINKAEHSITFRASTGQSTFYILGAEHSVGIRGMTLAGIIADEIAFYKPKVYELVIRPTLSSTKGWAIFISTPQGKNDFYTLYMRGKEGIKEWESFHITSEQVAALNLPGMIDEEEIKSLKDHEMSPEGYRQEYLAEFLYFAGKIYTQFSHDRHIIPSYEPSPQDKIIISLDFGQVNPTAVLWGAITPDGRTIIYKEYYKEKSLISEHIENIKKIDGRDTLSVIADPSTFATNRTKMVGGLEIQCSVAELFGDGGIMFDRADNSVISGINIVQEMFAHDKLFITSNCEKLIWELDNYRWADNKNRLNDPEKPMKINDHAVDALRYLCAERTMNQVEVKKTYGNQLERLVDELYQEMSEINITF